MQSARNLAFVGIWGVTHINDAPLFRLSTTLQASLLFDSAVVLDVTKK